MSSIGSQPRAFLEEHTTLLKGSNSKTVQVFSDEAVVALQYILRSLQQSPRTLWGEEEQDLRSKEEEFMRAVYETERRFLKPESRRFTAMRRDMPLFEAMRADDVKAAKLAVEGGAKADYAWIGGGAGDRVFNQLMRAGLQTKEGVVRYLTEEADEDVFLDNVIMAGNYWMTQFICDNRLDRVLVPKLAQEYWAHPVQRQGVVSGNMLVIECLQKHGQDFADPAAYDEQDIQSAFGGSDTNTTEREGQRMVTFVDWMRRNAGLDIFSGKWKIASLAAYHGFQELLRQLKLAGVNIINDGDTWNLSETLQGAMVAKEEDNTEARECQMKTIRQLLENGATPRANDLREAADDAELFELLGGKK